MWRCYGRTIYVEESERYFNIYAPNWAEDDNFYHTSQRHITCAVLTAAARLRALLGYNHLFYRPPWEELITNYVRSLVQMVLSDGPAVWTSPPTSTSDLGGRVTPGNMESEAHAAGRMESGGMWGFGVRIEKKKNDKKRWGGYKMGVSDQCWMAAFKAPWIQGSLQGPWSPRSWFCYYTACSCDGQMAQSIGACIHTHSTHAGARRINGHNLILPFLVSLEGYRSIRT